MRPDSVLLVTGAYYPEISAAGLQCRAVARALNGRIRFGVLATAVDRTLPAAEKVEGIDVYRIGVDVQSRLSKAAATARVLGRMVGLGRAYDVVHLHGFSQKNVPVMLAARVARKPTILSLHTSGQDEPEAVRQQGAVAHRLFMSADLMLPVSAELGRKCLDAGVPPERVRVVPNGIDTERFRPLPPDERRRLRHALGWNDEPVVLFVGFFSADKRPDVVFRAFKRLVKDHKVPARLVFAGATGSSYFEIDRTLADNIRVSAAAARLSDRVQFVEPTNDIVRYFQAADVFALSSVREAHPVALLEAMACGRPVVATRLPGATDAVVEDGVSGVLFPADDDAALAAALRDILGDPVRAARLGERARDTIVRRFQIGRTADGWLTAYRDVVSTRRPHP